MGIVQDICSNFRDVVEAVVAVVPVVCVLVVFMVVANGQRTVVSYN